MTFINFNIERMWISFLDIVEIKGSGNILKNHYVYKNRCIILKIGRKYQSEVQHLRQQLDKSRGATSRWLVAGTPGDTDYVHWLAVALQGFFVIN